MNTQITALIHDSYSVELWMLKLSYTRILNSLYYENKWQAQMLQQSTQQNTVIENTVNLVLDLN